MEGERSKERKEESQWLRKQHDIRIALSLNSFRIVLFDFPVLVVGYCHRRSYLSSDGIAPSSRVRSLRLDPSQEGDRTDFRRLSLARTLEDEAN